MKNRFLICFLTAIIGVSICACGTDTTVNIDSSETQTEIAKTESNAPVIPSVEVMEETGDGEMYIATPSGTSENGEIPFFYLSDGEVYTELSLCTSEFDGSKLSYVYVDGEFNCKEQLSDADISVGLENTALIVGTHVVEVKQFENNDENGTLVTYKVAKYEIKSE